MKTGTSSIGLAAVWLLLGGCAYIQGGQGCSRNDTVTVNHASAYLKAKPACVQVPAGSTLTVRLVPAKAAGSARTRAKSGNPAWLDKENEKEDTILIEVPQGAQSGGASCDETSCTYEYEIYVDDVGMLDPRVRVTN